MFMILYLTIFVWDKERACQGEFGADASVWIFSGEICVRGVCVCVCLRYRVCDKYSVFISMSGGVSGGQGDRFLLVGRLRMRGNNVPWGPPALDSRNRKQHPAHKPPSALSQYLFALITQNVIVHHAG